jgi:glycosyltransferase involved in cell wall biosynthesis
MKFSIVTPFFNNNEGDYIEKIYNSIINQTYDNWEWIITDDFSNDNTLNVLKTFKDPRIKLITQKKKKELFINPHLYSTGDIVVQVDSDDQMYPKSLEVYNHFFSNNPDVFFMSVGTNYFEDGKFASSHIVYHDEFKNCYEKKIEKDKNWNSLKINFLHINGAWGNLHAWRNLKEIDFNPKNYKNLIYPDLLRALTLEEYGKYLHLPRTLYQNNLRSKSLSQDQMKNHEVIDYCYYLNDVKERRKTDINSYDKRYNDIFEESYMLLHSNLSLEKTSKNVSIFNIEKQKQQKLKELYFDHNLFFDIISEDIDYCFLFVEKQTDLNIIDKLKIKNVTIYTPFFLNKKINLSFLFNRKKEYINFYGCQILVLD